MPAWSVVYTIREVTGEVVIAITWLADTVCASNDDVGIQGSAGAVVTVWITSASVETSSGVARELSVRRKWRIKLEY